MSIYTSKSTINLLALLRRGLLVGSLAHLSIDEEAGFMKHVSGQRKYLA